jgi:hypothetical protein
VGAYHDDSKRGSAYIFRRSGEEWTQQAKLTAPDAGLGDRFGRSVSISGEYVIVGTRFHNAKGLENSGAAYIFEDSGGNWVEQARLSASDGAPHDHFGTSVSVDGDYALVGASYDDDNGRDSGSVYVFKRRVCPTADLNGDCYVDFADLAIIADQWLQGGE